METRADGMEILSEDGNALRSGVTSIERDPMREHTVWVEFGDGSCTSGIRYSRYHFGWDRPELIEAATLDRCERLFS